MSQEATPLHPEIVPLLDDMEATPAGPRLPDDAVRRWAEHLRTLPDHQVLAEHLIVLTQRFSQHGAMAAARQTLVLALALVGASRAAAALESGGLDADAARKVLAGTGGAGSPLGDGLKTPSAGDAPLSGGRRQR